MWRGSLLPLGCAAAPNQATELHLMQRANRFGSASHSNGSKLPRHSWLLLQARLASTVVFTL
ncbi:hypothetical protein EXW72_20405 [Pseudomonas sp. BCA14]|nr:hypothetical protein EXW70_20555 [Pseudomonas sp. JMN1]TFF06492.1 hypothetical protein EXW71_23165 [Pseudomonas sp. BCA17]TFF22481.1 hypothetical protein EXW72_20405 [Pseudomonas sp. BCA14]TFF26901.1 hypothetical protein EXW73_13405 [Pseudomonas sp. BCA13]